MIRRYPGSKTGSGVIQKILSLMPRHDRYVEPFLGGGIVLELKRPSRSSIAADVDPAVIAHHKRAALPGVDYRHVGWDQLLPSLDLTSQDLVYLDPPYHPVARSKKRLYRFEMDDAGHRRLLRWCLEADCQVMLSGYRCELYDAQLSAWHRTDFGTMTRGGARVESVWTNFPPGLTFHDVRFLGGDFRGRERIKRKRTRWLSRFLAMSDEDRAVVLEALESAALTIASAGVDHRLGRRCCRQHRGSPPAAMSAAAHRRS
jgi:hypothetical protein